MPDNSGGNEARPAGRKVDDYLEVLKDHVPTQFIVVGSHGGDRAPDFDRVVAVEVSKTV